MLIDSHCHILKDEYDNPDEIIEEAYNNGISKIIINGYDIKSSIESCMLADKYDYVYVSVGIGPENIDNITDDDINKIRTLANNKKVVAIGEIGLDYYWTKDNKDKQINIFKSMLSIAKDNNLPVIVHSRSAIKDTYDLLKEYNVRGIMHCYSGSKESAKEFIKLGFLIGVGGIITFKNAKEIKDVVSNIDIENISLETDSPYLSPEPNRGKINSPLNLKYIAKKVSEIKEISYEDVCSITSNNVIKLLDL